jgi:hypothetical protein
MQYKSPHILKLKEVINFHLKLEKAKMIMRIGPLISNHWLLKPLEQRPIEVTSFSFSK